MQSSEGVGRMVAEIIKEKKHEIAALCRKHGVRALWVFGSAATGAFHPESSDIDFLVDMGEYDERVHRRFFGLLHELEELTGRSVDLLTVKSIDNPYLMEELEETRRLVYGPKDAEAAA
jgi:predicted nucleotidyltransferase